MKLLISGDRIVGTATDAYRGPQTLIDVPDGFDETKMGEYRFANGALSIPVPTTVTMRQARLALLEAGLLDQVETNINGRGQGKGRLLIEWNYSNVVERNSPWVVDLGPALGLTEAQLDQLFVTASTL